MQLSSNVDLACLKFLDVGCTDAGNLKHLNHRFPSNKTKGI